MTHNPFREVKAAMVCQHLLNCLRNELAIFRVYEPPNIRLSLGPYRLDQAHESETAPETSSRNPTNLECPATHMREALSLRKVELCLLPVFDVEVNADPIQ